MSKSVQSLWLIKYQYHHKKQNYLVVISTRGEQLMVSAPLQTAHFLSVSLQAPLWLQRRRPRVSLEDHTISASRRQLVGVPSQSSCNQSNFNLSLSLDSLSCSAWMTSKMSQLYPGWFFKYSFRIISEATITLTHQLWLCGPPRQKAFCQQQHPRSEHSLCEFPRLQGYPKNKVQSIFLITKNN